MSGKATPATTAVQRAGVSHSLHEYRHDPSAESYGLEAAEALGLAPDRVFKTLVVSVDGRLAVAILPVHRHLSLKAVAAAFGAKKAAMADAAAAQRATGYVLGGISPFGQRSRLPTVVDPSAEGQSTIFVSAGRRGLEIELAPEDLVRLTGATVAPIADDSAARD